MSFRTTSTVSAAVAFSLLFAACGSESTESGSESAESGSESAEAEAESAEAGSESAGGDVDAFCDELRRMDSEETVDMEDDFDAAMAEMERVRELAPGEIRGDIDVVIDKFREFEELEANSSGDEAEEFGAAFALAFDPQFIAAAENLEAFGVEECGLEPSSDGDDDFTFDEADGEPSGDGIADDDADGATADGAAPVEGQLVTEAADVPDPLYEPFFNDEPLDTSELSIDGAQYFLDVNYTDAPWRTKLGSWSIFGSEVGTAGVDIIDSEAPEVCGALLDYLQSVAAEADTTIVVSTYGQEDDGGFSDEEELLRTTVADGC